MSMSIPPGCWCTRAHIRGQGRDTRHIPDNEVFRTLVIKLIWANLHEACGESCFLHRAIGDEFNPEAVWCWLDVLGHLVSAECPDQRSRRTLAVSNLQEVVNAIIVILDLKRLELESDLKILRHSEALSWNISSQSPAIWFNPIVTKVSKQYRLTSESWYPQTVPDSPDTLLVGLIVLREVWRLQLPCLHVQITSANSLKSEMWRFTRIFIRNV